jgi:serine/threonine protein kinase
MDAYDSDLETVMDELSRQQMNCVIAQVVQGIVYLHRHGAVHHDINPSSILINIRQDVGETREEAVADDDSFRVEAAIYDFQSVAIPSARYLLQEHMEALSWGPFARPNLHETTDSGRIDRWLSGWAPKKTTRRFLRRDFGTANPWTIDCSSVAMMFLLNNMEIYEAYKASSVSDYRDHPEFSVFFNVVNLFQSHAKNAEDAIEELEATARTLSFDATAVNSDGGVGWDDSDFTQSS